MKCPEEQQEKEELNSLLSTSAVGHRQQSNFTEKLFIGTITFDLFALKYRRKNKCRTFPIEF